MIQFNIITLFPNVLEIYFSESIIKRALQKKIITIKIHNLRDYTADKHHTADDRPYGGGPGMILMVEPIYKALQKIRNKKTKKSRVILLTPAGKKFTQHEAKRLAQYQQIVLICGRYEGFDARVDTLVDEKISIGDYVLAGGELPALVVTEVIARHIPGVVGHKDALIDETFSHGPDYIEYPQYTRPEQIKLKKGNKTSILKVPKVLLSGNHKEIAAWRNQASSKRG